MDYPLPARYLASVFVTTPPVPPKPEIISGLTEVLKHLDLVPTMAQEFTAGGVVPRIALVRVDGSLSVALGSTRFDVVQKPLLNEKWSHDDFTAFLDLSADALTHVLQHLGLTGHRLAAVQEGMLGLDDEKLNELANRLLSLPAPFAKAPPFEWDWRYASRIQRQFAGSEEPTNTIVTVRRLAGTITRTGNGIATASDFDDLRVDLDVNTVPTRTDARFTPEAVEGFCEQAKGWHADLSADVQDLLGGLDV